ncbi:DUF481 domain-containing protein [Sphingobium sufflavum]|uniref:DUF481 domain-containing protein n=1 Tax=Sphingobium sufflavum TaxID=1129547 RepID=UPI001F2DD449|nr:DUF481 domain-containing protein [Sphingobium sufflavum]MCE7795965.1 DUF481 domain-containing protein [Sphingobium sufflavum]
MPLPALRRLILMAPGTLALVSGTTARAEIPPPVEAMIREAARSGDQSTVDAVVKIAKLTNPGDTAAIDILASSLLAARPPFIPPSVEAIVREAARAGDSAVTAPVVRAAKATNPQQADAIETLAMGLLTAEQEKARQEREQRLASLRYLQGWKGQGQAGFGLTSGNTEEMSAVIGLSVKKEGLQSRHKFEALADYLRTNDLTTREKFGASYSLDWLLRQGFYVYGVVGWERDRFAGYSRRFTESFGIGLRAIDGESMTLDLDAGPALRQTAFTDNSASSDIGARASLNYKWVLSSSMNFTELASVISAEGRMTLTATSAFTSKITKALSGRLSFNVQSESNRADGAKPTDTATRATLVYEF